MCFKDIYEKVEDLKNYSISELIEKLNINVIVNYDIDCEAIYVNYLKPTIIVSSYEVKDCILLHEIGHSLFDRIVHVANKTTNENNANIFMCLMLLKNDIWNADFFDTYLINQGVNPKVARKFNDAVYQRKIQIKYDISY